MKIRYEMRFHVSAAWPNLIGNKERTQSAKRYLQYFDEEKQEWLDVPTVVDETSRQKTIKEVRGY